MSVQVVASQLEPDGRTLYLVDSDLPLENGTVLEIQDKPAATLYAHFLTEGDMVTGREGSRRVREAERVTNNRYLYSERADCWVLGPVDEVQVRFDDGTRMLVRWDADIAVASRECEDCGQTWVTGSRTWPDSRECQKCQGVLDPNEGMGF